MTIFCILS